MKKKIELFFKIIFCLCILLLTGNCSNEPTKTKSDAAKNTDTIKFDLGNGVFLEMIEIKAGTYMRGMPQKEIEMLIKKCKTDFCSEFIQHNVTLTKDFYIGKYEVTQAQWKAVMGNNPSKFKGDNLPVDSVSWNDCQEFIEKLNRLCGKKFRLPTEAEWEYAARAGTKTAYYWGDEFDWKKCNSASYWAKSNLNTLEEWEKYFYKKTIELKAQTMPVGSFKPNNWGLYDMTGNVGEWCQDWYEPYSTLHQIDPKGAKNGNSRVMHGGAWDYGVDNCNIARRSQIDPSYRYCNYGFRLAQTN